MSSSLSYPTRSQFLSSFNQNQPFAFPNSIIYYISKNPSTAKLYQKMIQSCKYFFVKNPIIVISRLLFFCRWQTYANGKYLILNLTNSSTKLWITQGMSFYESKTMIVLCGFCENIYRSEVTTLFISNQTITLDLFLLLSSNVEDLEFNGVTVKYNNGSIVPFEKIVEVLPKIKSIDYFDSSSSISSQTFKKLLKVPHFLTLNCCKLNGVRENFDIESFYNYMKKNNRTKVCLRFADPLSEANKNRLEEIIDEIIEDKNHDYKAPYIYFPGMNEEKRMKLLSYGC